MAQITGDSEARAAGYGDFADYQNKMAQKTAGGGGATPRLDFVKGITSEYLASDAAYKAPQDAARKALIDYWGSREGAVDRFSRISDETGLGEQQKLVDSLTRNVMTNQDLIDAIEPSVNQRSGDFLINDADRTAIIARERAPVEQNLTKLLRSKEYAEIGLQGKQNLVSTLLQLSFQDDEMGAKPLQLGVDYTTEDRTIARQMFADIMGAKIGAFSGDQGAQEARDEAERNRVFQREMNTINFEQSKEMENLSSANSLKNSLAIKAASGGGSGAATPTSNPIYQGKTKQQIKDIEQKTEGAWNKIVGSSKTEYDVWRAINQNQKTLGDSGVDVRDLWARHSALKAKVGQGGSIRKDSSDDLY